MKVIYLLTCISITFFITSCLSTKNTAVLNDELVNKNSIEKTMINPSQAKKNKPIVSRSHPKTSKPISESAGNADEHRFDDVYIVPNRFPLKDKQNKKDCIDKNNEKDDSQINQKN